MSLSDLNSGLSLLEQSMLELKIYMPYFISNETIIQYQQQLKDVMTPKKLSIMDILEAHFLEKKSASRLFFKVDLSDQAQNSENLKLNFEEPNSSFARSCVNKILGNNKTLKSNEMEEIVEINSFLELEKNEESKLGDESLFVERSNKYDKIESSGSSMSRKKEKKRCKT